jgi:aminopeptidase N
MPGRNLTRDEARQRAALLNVESYAVDLDLTDQENTETFGSTTVIRFSCSRPGAATFADLVGARVHEITLNGSALDPTTAYRNSRIALPDLAADNELRVVADCTYSHTGEGLHRFVDPADGRIYLYTQHEVPDARQVFTTFEQPDLKSVFTFTVHAPESWKVISNSATPEPEPTGPGTATWRFPTTQRLSTYITCVVAGEYHEALDAYPGPNGTISLGHYCRQSMVTYLDTEELVTLTRQGFEFFEAAFDYPYPFGKYDQVYLPEFNNGAMENAGLVTLRDEYLSRSKQARWWYEQRANTILHEMAHMWFGDLVTMRWWDDLWLNESFAEWAAHHAAAHATKYAEAWTGFANNRKNWAYRQDQLPTSHPIAADNPDLESVEVNFDGITYAKGASALKQLVAWVGEEEFHAGLSNYFHRHAFGNSDFSDLLTVLEETSGRDLHAWAAEWLRTSGPNTLAARFETDSDDAFTSFAVHQLPPRGGSTLRRHRIGIGLYDLDDAGLLVRRTRVEIDVQGELTEVPKLVGMPRPDLVLVNDGDLTFAKVRFDHRSLATVLSSIGRLDDSLARAVCWNATWDMVREGELSATQFVELVLAGLARETDETAVKQLPIYVQVAIDQFSHPDKRRRLRERWEKGIRELVEAADPGSDRQITLLRMFAGFHGKRIPPSSFGGAGRSEAATDFLAGLLDGTVVLDGFQVGQDMRWILLTGLAANGKASRDDIIAERARDLTISGQERAAAALAVMPDPAAKAAAWSQAVEDDSVTNETQRSIAYAFDVSGQEEVLQPYLDRYLAAAETLWEDRSVQIAQTALEYMFPRSLTGQAALDTVTSWLARTRANPAALKYVREAAADLARAVRAQELDAP